MSAMNITDAAIAQAFRERLESMYSPLTVREVMKAVEARARELDATYQSATDSAGIGRFEGAKGWEFIHSERCQERAYECCICTPPAQAAEAVERVARAVAAIARPNISFEQLSAVTTRECYRMARAAIAAMQAGE